VRQQGRGAVGTGSVCEQCRTNFRKFWTVRQDNGAASLERSILQPAAEQRSILQPAAEQRTEL